MNIPNIVDNVAAVNELRTQNNLPYSYAIIHLNV